MIDDETPTLVLGEAPESDDEDVLDTFKATQLNIANSTQLSIAKIAVVGEALESDEEIEIHNIELRQYQPSTSANSETKSKIEDKSSYKKKVNPSSLKKLNQINKSLHNNLTSFKKQILTSTNHELNNINQQLLKSQIELQQTLTHAKSVKVNLNELNKKLNNIVVANYIPKINIQVPSHII